MSKFVKSFIFVLIYLSCLFLHHFKLLENVDHIEDFDNNLTRTCSAASEGPAKHILCNII